MSWYLQKQGVKVSDYARLYFLFETRRIENLWECRRWTHYTDRVKHKLKEMCWLWGSSPWCAYEARSNAGGGLCGGAMSSNHNKYGQNGANQLSVCSLNFWWVNSAACQNIGQNNNEALNLVKKKIIILFFKKHPTTSFFCGKKIT